MGDSSAAERQSLSLDWSSGEQRNGHDVAYAALQAARGREGPGPSNPPLDTHNLASRSELEELRREIARMKEERNAHGEAPPSYEEELRFANALAKQNYS